MAGGLQLEFVDWQSPANNLRHRTAEISSQRLLVRRGQPFTITLHFRARGYQPGVDSAHLVAETGDEVYLEAEAERQEYVLNEEGLVYQGNKNWIHPAPWNYGQFEEDILGICLRLLDRSLSCRQHPARDAALRSSAVYVSRVVSAMINSNDDSGVLVGNWSEDYSGGVRPTEWSSSLAILRQWDQAGGRPVRFGQCWVFAAVMCTVMRCLGIPARVVTNFDSGHEKDGDLLIDVFYDQTGRLLPAESKDSIWNFHAWDECWMARRDLPAGYGGWQVLDATPQERSNGLYCCGPAPVRAIREGALHLRYDAPFVFSMVNADRVAWLLSGTRKEKLRWETSAVGKHISTKRVGSPEREDVTHAYKPPEGSLEERQVFLKALTRRRGLPTLLGAAARSRAGVPPAAAALRPPPRSAPAEGGGGDEEQPPPRGAQTGLRLRLAESPEIGRAIRLVLLAQNREAAPKELRLRLSAQALLHDGTPRPPFWQETLYLAFSPQEEKRIPWAIPYRQYGPQLGEDKQVHVTAMGQEKTSWQTMLAEKTVTVACPTIAIHVLGPVAVNQASPLQADFANPLSEPVDGCLLTLEGSGLVRGQAQIPLGPLGAQQRASIQFQLTPHKGGQRQLHVSLRSSRFPPIKGHKQLEVGPAASGVPGRRRRRLS
ncbi:protein-glutamine gamma-glutamyltransferase 5-like isoform X2 [Hemicordylus capensis]|uniref:protein-glutamine gamma-glutamyltransferase 5-like isoform X2 n=1 Tax=Hemicordylus capensis TaxID=884348 RepID=UPI002303DDE6|nr:protein-glutamine gamma-glutamyltransferase 5-like isoform X2 [Hemicordylus capensis]